MFAKKFIEVLQSDFVIVNMDESMFMSNEIIARAWIKKGKTRNFAIQAAFKHTSLTAAVTTDG